MAEKLGVHIVDFKARVVDVCWLTGFSRREEEALCVATGHG
jgi:hypothetical protein